MKVLILSLITFCGLLPNSESIAVECDFKDTSSGYTCEVKSIEITSKYNQTITEVNENHINNKTNDDVKFFKSYNHTVKFFPLGLVTKFNNL